MLERAQQLFLCKQVSLASAWMANETMTAIILKPLRQSCFRDWPCPYHVFLSPGIMKLCPLTDLLGGKQILIIVSTVTATYKSFSTASSRDSLTFEMFRSLRTLTTT